MSSLLLLSKPKPKTDTLQESNVIFQIIIFWYEIKYRFLKGLAKWKVLKYSSNI